MTTGTSGPMMAMPQAPMNGNQVMGSMQNPPQQTSPPAAVNNNQMMSNPEGAQQFCLRWNSYPATVATQLAALRAAEDFVDVTLACDGRQLRAHKLVLSACSPYFMQLFKSTPCKHPVIFLKDVGFRQLVALLEFMYAGEVNVSQAELPALLRTAEALQVRGLADTNPNNNNFPSPPKPSFPQSYDSGSDMGQGQTVPTSQTTPQPSGEPITGVVCPTQNSNTNQSCDPSSIVNSCTNSSTGKRSQNSPSGKNEEEESDSNDSQDFDMAGMIDDGSLSQQFEDTGEVFPQNIGDAGSFELTQGDLGNELTGENHTDEECSEVEEDDDGLEKVFPGFPNDGSFPHPGGLNNIVGPPNGDASLSAGPSGNLANLAGGDAGNLLMKGEEGLANSCLPPPPPGSGGRNRLARSLWPPGIPYHGPQQCPYCPRVLSNVGNWRKHVLTMHFAREKVYKCRHCASAFRTSEYLQKHYVRVHNYPQKMTRKKCGMDGRTDVM
ncbi:Longitudinals lacking protein-like [Orchesella cincta]|uniref:Longitudinals lacking protein-like n=1 Tax=Orchesella cincta TaxID=48709 RepID=A0A1D2MR63_ORCCI|nr:Longitudinals lacking protein-like [Orchesella cincta]